MDALNPVNLAPLLPIPEHSAVFQYYITLDSTYSVPSISGVAVVDLNQLPQQISVMATQTKGGQQWYAGVNVYQNGGDVMYQPFYWGGGAAPPQGPLTSSSYKAAGTAVVLSSANPNEATVALAEYTWLTTSVQPLFCDFALEILSGVATPDVAVPAPQIVETLEYVNNSNYNVQYSPKVTYEYDQTAQASVTDTHNFQAGISTTWKGKVGWFVAESEFSITLSFNYSYSHSTTATDTSMQKYIVEQPESFTLPPGGTIYASIILSVDQNATATISLNFQLSGTINGQPLSGGFLEQLANAMAATTIQAVSDTTITYTVTGTVNSKVVASSMVTTQSTPPASGPSPTRVEATAQQETVGV